MNPNVSPTFISGIIQNCSLPKYILIKYTNCVIKTEILASLKFYMYFNDAIIVYLINIYLEGYNFELYY